jgi:hypothetical protein
MKSFPSSSGLLVGENSMKGIGGLERQMDDFAIVQREMQMHNLFGHFGINLDA